MGGRKVIRSGKKDVEIDRGVIINIDSRGSLEYGCVFVRHDMPDVKYSNN